MMKKEVAIYWLIPAAPERDLFSQVINILCTEFRAARFKPHLTLCKAVNKASAGKLLRGVSAARIRLQVRGVGHSTKFTKTLFIRFHTNEPLRNLVSQLGGNPAGVRDPHVSLVYQHLPEKTRRELAATIRLPFREVMFDTVSAMSCVSPTETQADVRSWHTLASKRLSR